MATFEDTRSLRTQTHFEVLEIDLPVITGTCTLGSSNGFGTPLSCDQAWAGEYKTYKFTNTDAPILKGSIYRCIKSISETPAEIKPSKGLSSRGSLNVTFADFAKQDPNPEAAGVTDEVKNRGTFFGKLKARQVFENKPVRLKLYRIEQDGTIDLVNGAQTKHYLGSELKYNPTNTQWTLECKDPLSVANLEEKTWPLGDGGYVRLDIDETTTSIAVDTETDYSNAFAVRVGDEFMEVVSVSNNMALGAALNVTARGSAIYAPVSGELLTLNEAQEHSAGDEVFICALSDDETVDSLLTRVLTDSDVGASLIPSADWAAEVAEWHALDKINTLHSESEDVNEVIGRILTGFLMDMWFEPIDNEIKLSAISVWKQSTTELTEGKEVNAYTVKKTANDSLRASRALVLYDKRRLSDDDEATSYRKGSRFSDGSVISEALYGKHKDKVFDNNFLIGESAANLLTQRYVSRFRFTPFVRSWQTDERYMTYKTGDVVDLVTTADQSFDGGSADNIRAQILSVKTKYGKSGRVYDVKSMSYEPAFADNSEIVITGSGTFNLYEQAGAPPSAVTLTFIFDGGYSQGETAIRAGAFPTGSKIIIIMVNGFTGYANGGAGGHGNSFLYNSAKDMYFPTVPAGNGQAGGIVYDAQGVDTDIYFSGATPSAAYPEADGYMFAPSGGDGGFESAEPYAGNGGNGGDGRVVGAGGAGGVSGQDFQGGINGVNGSPDGSNSGWGMAGANNDAVGGAAGSGIVDSGATVLLFGADANRYVNGNGDH